MKQHFGVLSPGGKSSADSWSTTVDDAVASLISDALATDEWVAQWAIDHLLNPDAVLYFPDSWGAKVTMAAIQASELTQQCRIADTPFVLNVRPGAIRCP
jgi:hypothetical protein